MYEWQTKSGIRVTSCVPRERDPMATAVGQIVISYCRWTWRIVREVWYMLTHGRKDA